VEEVKDRRVKFVPDDRGENDDLGGLVVGGVPEEMKKKRKKEGSNPWI